MILEADALIARDWSIGSSFPLALIFMPNEARRDLTVYNAEDPSAELRA